jgi:hypothetical protein
MDTPVMTPPTIIGVAAAFVVAPPPDKVTVVAEL